MNNMLCSANSKHYSGGVTNRIKFISYLQIIGIVLVVLGHSFHMFPDGEHGQSLLIYRMIFSFHMPLFVFISGYLMEFTTFSKDKDRTPSILHFTVNKIKRLLIPFATLVIITFVPRTFLSGLADDPCELSWHNFYRSVFFFGEMVIPYLWFLQAIFILLVFNYIMLKLSAKGGRNSRLITYLLLAIIFIFLPFLSIEWTTFFSLNEVIRFGIYFIIGALYAKYQQHIDTFIRWNSCLFLCVAICVWVVLFFIFEKTAYFKFCSIAGIVMSISFAKIIETKRWKFIDHLEGASFVIFLLSWFCNVASQQMLSHFVTLPWWCYSILSLIAGIYIPWIGYRYLISHPQSKWVRITSFLLGQKI